MEDVQISLPLLIGIASVLGSFLTWFISNFIKLRKAKKEYEERLITKTAEETSLKETTNASIKALQVEVDRVKEDIAEIKDTINLKDKAIWTRIDKIHEKLDKVIEMIFSLSEK